jgi:hypothetical protein
MVGGPYTAANIGSRYYLLMTPVANTSGHQEDTPWN